MKYSFLVFIYTDEASFLQTPRFEVSQAIKGLSESALHFFGQSISVTRLHLAKLPNAK